jgi:Pectate lyase superfamily protein
MFSPLFFVCVAIAWPLVFTGTITVSSSTALQPGDLTCTGVNDRKSTLIKDLIIQNAITILNSSAINGGTLQLSEGVFNLNGQIDLISNLVLAGSGLGVTILKLVDNSSTFELGLATPGTIRGKLVNNIVIQDLSMDGNRANNNATGAMTFGKHGIRCEQCTELLVKNVEFSHFPGHGYLNLSIALAHLDKSDSFFTLQT